MCMCKRFPYTFFFYNIYWLEICGEYRASIVIYCENLFFEILKLPTSKSSKIQTTGKIKILTFTLSRAAEKREVGNFIFFCQNVLFRLKAFLLIYFYYSKRYHPFLILIFKKFPILGKKG